jgi:hypothetical protein
VSNSLNVGTDRAGGHTIAGPNIPSSESSLPSIEAFRLPIKTVNGATIT